MRSRVIRRRAARPPAAAGSRSAAGGGARYGRRACRTDTSILTYGTWTVARAHAIPSLCVTLNENWRSYKTAPYAEWAESPKL
ncbi:hypothetical protein EVAR_3396_1 [Eumeta japonica]|uniref:Uncharacterized protein n=1 Tax=Eumeta variegata TaxID=151549 RepID=A0A4C1SSZ1_EUMVA|nr:hypothetical protein EVAR_3396_1 [Eumeta japonica]